MKENPIGLNNMFATPMNMEALMAYCERFTGNERVVAFTAASMALNLAHKMVDEAMKGESK
jgi:hypothetical protein